MSPEDCAENTKVSYLLWHDSEQMRPVKLEQREDSGELQQTRAELQRSLTAQQTTSTELQDTKTELQESLKDHQKTKADLQQFLIENMYTVLIETKYAWLLVTPNSVSDAGQCQQEQYSILRNELQLCVRV